MPETNITFADNLCFIFKMVWRCLCFAIGGAVVMALWGGLHGFWTGIIAALCLLPRQELFAGAFFGVFYAVVVGSVGGACSFSLVALVTYSARYPGLIFCESLKGAFKASLLGIVIGGTAGAINLFAYDVLTGGESSAESAGWGVFYGVIAGYSVGTLYGAMRGALQESRWQRDEFDAGR
jgi:hypothetical protein